MEEATLQNLARAKLREVRTRLLVSPAYQRRFQAFCIGMEKTGTTSAARLFRRNFRSEHEPDWPGLIRQIVRSDRSWAPLPPEALRRRDKRLWLEFDSCWLHVFNVFELTETFPDARFILTVRDCYTWLDSLANHVLAQDVGPLWRRAQEAYYRPGAFTYGKGQNAWERAGLYPLRAYLTAWSWHNRRVLEAVPPERLLVVATSKIKEAGADIASFLGIEPALIETARGHVNRNRRRRFEMLERIDRNLLEDTVNELCGDLMVRWFPGVQKGGAPRSG